MVGFGLSCLFYFLFFFLLAGLLFVSLRVFFGFGVAWGFWGLVGFLCVWGALLFVGGFVCSVFPNFGWSSSVFWNFCFGYFSLAT